MLPWLLLTACESEEAVVVEMERGLYTSHAAIAAQLLATEFLVHTFEEPDTQLRHGTACGCPCTERIGTIAPFVLTLDYDVAGCLPESGIVPATIAGHAVLDWDGTDVDVVLQDFAVGMKNPLTGAIAGVPNLSGTEVAMSAEITAGDWSAVIEGTTGLDDTTGLVLDAKVAVSGPWDGVLELKGVALGWEDIPPPCPAPAAGLVVLTGDKHDVEIDFTNPGVGFVQVSRDNRVSESVDYCGYRTELF